MLKIPFIEHTGVGIEITSDAIRWMEVQKLGNRIRYQSSGEYVHNNGERSLKGAIEQLKENLSADAYHVGVTVPEALLKVHIEEVPYSEEPEETEQWISHREIEFLASVGDTEVLIQHHLIEIDEDNKRCLFQVLDRSIIERVKQSLFESGIQPEYLGSGLLEVGYSQIHNPEFLEETSAVLCPINEKVYVLLFDKGLLHNSYELSNLVGADLTFLIEEADSILQTEEASTDLAAHSIPLYVSIIAEGKRMDEEQLERSICRMHPMEGKKGFDASSESQLRSAGALSKLFYPGLDRFNFLEQAEVETGVLHHDKKEALRLGVLLFVPVLFFALVSYAFGKVVDYRLVESNQIMAQIGDKIEVITQKRARLIETSGQFLEAKVMLEDKQAVAYLFELVGEQIPEDSWIVSMSIKNDANERGNIIRLTGYSKSEASLSRFLNQLEITNGVDKARLLISEKVDEPTRNQTQNTPDLVGATRFEVEIGVSKQ